MSDINQNGSNSNEDIYDSNNQNENESFQNQGNNEFQDSFNIPNDGEFNDEEYQNVLSDSKNEPKLEQGISNTFFKESTKFYSKDVDFKNFKQPNQSQRNKEISNLQDKKKQKISTEDTKEIEQRYLNFESFLFEDEPSEKHKTITLNNRGRPKGKDPKSKKSDTNPKKHDSNSSDNLKARFETFARKSFYCLLNIILLFFESKGFKKSKKKILTRDKLDLCKISFKDFIITNAEGDEKDNIKIYEDLVKKLKEYSDKASGNNNLLDLLTDGNKRGFDLYKIIYLNNSSYFYVKVCYNGKNKDFQLEDKEKFFSDNPQIKKEQFKYHLDKYFKISE